MTSQSSPAIARAARAAPLRSWRTVVGLTAAAGGVTIEAGAFLPWVSAFAGLIQVPGVRGSNGRIMLAAGVVIAAAGLYWLIYSRPAPTAVQATAVPLAEEISSEPGNPAGSGR